MKNRERSKKHCIFVHIRGDIMTKESAKKVFTVQNSEVFTLERDILSKNCYVGPENIHN